MREREYLAEKFINGRPSHSLCGQSKADALKWVTGLLSMAIRVGNLKDRCTPETAKKVVALIDRHQYTEAIEAWNTANVEFRMALHEIKYMARNCHHDPVTTVALEDVFYLVEPALDDTDKSIVIHVSLFWAMEHAARFLRALISRQPPVRCDCDEAIKQRVRKHLRNNEIANAIDTWMAAKPNATIAIHRIRVSRKDCHESGQCRDCGCGG